MGTSCARQTNDCAGYLSHRHEREVQILTQLQAGPATPHELAKAIYTEIDAKLIPVAARNVFAHLLELHNKGLISVKKPIAFDGIFSHYHEQNFFTKIENILWTSESLVIRTSSSGVAQR